MAVHGADIKLHHRNKLRFSNPVVHRAQSWSWTGWRQFDGQRLLQNTQLRNEIDSEVKEPIILQSIPFQLQLWDRVEFQKQKNNSPVTARYQKSNSFQVISLFPVNWDFSKRFKSINDRINSNFSSEKFRSRATSTCAHASNGHKHCCNRS